MKLRVQLFGRLGTNLGSDIELEFSVEPTIRNVIQILIKKDPILESMLLKNNNLSPGTILLINGHPINRSELGLDKILKTRDKITLDRLGFLEIVGGG
ncbi:MAG: MoaD/ThiS family protein [Candidatus Hodarchaeota archaeon]